MRSYSAKEVRNLFLRAKRVARQQEFDFLVAPSQESCGGVVIVTPRRIGNAPQRNKAKRRIRELFRTEKWADLGLEMIIIVKKDGITLPYDQWKKLLAQSIKKYQATL